MQRVLTIMASSLKIWSRQRVAVVVSLLVPVAVMIVFGFVFGSMGSGGPSDSDPLEALFVDEDHSARSAALLEALRDLEGLEIDDLQPAPENGSAQPWTREAAEAAIRDGKAGLALVVPAGFADRLRSGTFSGDRAELTVLADSSLPTDSAIFNGMLMQVGFMTASSDMASQGMEIMGGELGMAHPQILQMQAWMEENARFINGGSDDASADQSAGEGTGSSPAQGFIDINTVDVLGESKENPIFSHQVAGVLTMFMLFTVAASGGSMLRERQNGTIRRMLISTTDPAQYLLGKYLAFFLIAYLQTWVMLLAGWLVFKVDIWGHLPALAVFGALVALAATSFGMLLASLCRSAEQVSSFSTLIILTMSAIGGSMLPRQFMPPALQRLGNFTFNGWAMDGFTGIFWYEKGLGQILMPCLVMAGIALVLFLAAARLFRSRLAY